MKNHAEPLRPFALLAKLAAVSLAIAGILLIRHPEPSERVVVVLVPDLTQQQLTAAMEQGRAPHLAALAATGLMASVDAPAAEPTAAAAAVAVSRPAMATVSGLTFWRRALAAAQPEGPASGVGGEQSPFWSGLGDSAVAVGLPDLLFPGLEGRRGAAAGGLGAAFVGGSAALPVDGTAVLAGRLPPPYESVADRVALAVAELADGKWSPWIETSETKEGGETRLQVLRADADNFLLSPLYRAAQVPTSPPTPFIAVDPFVDSAQPEWRPALVDHLLSVDSTRALAAEHVLGSSQSVHSVFYLFSVASSVSRLFGKTEPDPATERRVIGALDDRVALLSAALGDQGLIALVGGPGIDRSASGPGWLLVSTATGPRLEGSAINVAQLTRLLRYLVGVPLDVREREALPPSVLTRFPRRSRPGGGTDAAKRLVAPAPWSAEVLQGLLRPSSAS